MKKCFRKIAAMAVVCSMMMCTMVSFGATKYGFTNKGVRYEIGMDSKTAFKTLGTALRDESVNTCANGYINKKYFYGDNKTEDFDVYFEQDKANGKEIIASITLHTANVATEEGLKVGDSAAQVTKLYPTAKKGLGSYSVVDGRECIYIKMRADKVSYIAYQPASEK